MTFTFYKVPYGKRFLQFEQLPYFVLVTDQWDDYGNKTLFHLRYISERREQFDIGSVKIMHKDYTVTEVILPETFNSLDEAYCSIGQDKEYYENLKSLIPDDVENVLEALADAAYFPAIGERFENTDQFKESLLRFSEAEKMYKEARAIIAGDDIENTFDFNYKGQIADAAAPHDVEFDFRPNIHDIPTRITAIVGKNGTGKTQFLSKFALDLSGQTRNIREAGRFFPSRPLFSKVIAVSYSAFDRFTIPKQNNRFSYKYCGLRDSRGLKSSKKLAEDYEKAVKKIISKERQGDWYQILKPIIEEEILNNYHHLFFVEKSFEMITDRDHNLLSSGQSILMYVVTDVVADIRDESLLFFDEPEMHLHPNAISNLIRMMHLLLEKYNSYSIMCTHSPQILQEIPGKCVTVFEREGNIPITRQLGIESFGEDLSVISDEVFGVRDVRGNYKDVLEQLSTELDYDTVLQQFGNRLSLNAKVYLRNLY